MTSILSLMYGYFAKRTWMKWNSKDFDFSFLLIHLFVHCVKCREMCQSEMSVSLLCHRLQWWVWTKCVFMKTLSSFWIATLCKCNGSYFDMQMEKFKIHSTLLKWKSKMHLQYQNVESRHFIAAVMFSYWLEIVPYNILLNLLIFLVWSESTSLQRN